MIKAHTFLIPFVLVALACTFTGCTNNKRLTFKENDLENTNMSTPTAECPNGLIAAVTLEETVAANIIAGRSLRFRIEAAGCKYGYIAYSKGSSEPIQFDDAVTYTRMFDRPQPDAEEKITIVVLNARRQPKNQYVIGTTPFAIGGVRVSPVSCRINPSIITIPVAVDSNGGPLESVPPPVSFNLAATGAVRVTSWTPPDAAWFQLNVNSAIPTAAVKAQHTIGGTLVVTKPGSYDFTITDSNGYTNRCSADVRVNYVSGAIPQFYFRGDMTGDGIEDVLTRDPSSGTLWVAVGNSVNGFTFKNFGVFPPNEVYVDVLFADLNRDGKFDLIGRVQSSNLWKVAFSDGSRFLISDMGTWPTNLVLTNVALGDPNNDGMQDIVGKLNGVSYYAAIILGANFTATIINPIPQPAIMRLSAFPTSIPFDGHTDVSWTSENTTSCTLKKNSVDVTLPAAPNVAGVLAVDNLRATSAWELHCIQAGSGATVISAPATVVVAPPPDPNLSLSVKVAANDAAANASVIDPNTSVYLKWNAVNVSSCQLFQNSTVISTALTQANYVASAALALNASFQLKCISVAGNPVQTPVHTITVKTDMTFAPATQIDFGNITFGASSSPQTITFNAPINRAKPTNIRVTLPARYVFAGGTCVGSANTVFEINAGSTCTYMVKFTPATTGTATVAYTGPVSVTYNNGAVDVTETAVQLKGNGIVAGTTK